MFFISINKFQLSSSMEIFKYHLLQVLTHVVHRSIVFLVFYRKDSTMIDKTQVDV
jgi:hypothetical protein